MTFPSFRMETVLATVGAVLMTEKSSLVVFEAPGYFAVA